MKFQLTESVKVINWHDAVCLVKIADYQMGYENILVSSTFTNNHDSGQ